MARQRSDDAQVSLESEHLHRLTPADCQCRAAAAAAKADAIELERALADALACCESPKAVCAFVLTSDLLGLQAEERRNAAAADALTAFYQLAEVEGRSQRLETSLNEAESASRRVEKLHRDGLLGPIDRRSAERQELELLDQRSRLRSARTQLSAKLQSRLGCTVDESAGYWPEIDWTVVASLVDSEAEIACGLEQRQNLRALRLVLCRLSVETLPVARGVLKSADPSLGTATRPDRCLPSMRCADFECDELEVRREQLDRLLSAAEKAATAEIMSAVSGLRSAYIRAALANQTYSSRQATLDELVKKRDISETTWFEITQERLAVLSAESSLVERVIAVRLAQVALQKAQGTLAATCSDSTL